MNNLSDVVGGADMYGVANVQLVRDRFDRLNSALLFNYSYYEVPPGVYFNGDLSVSCWIKLHQSGHWPRIFDFGNGPSSNNIFFSISFGDTGLPAFETWNSASLLRVISNTVLELEQWTHLAYTLNGTTGTLYMNCTKVAESNMFIPENVNRTANFIGRSNWFSIDSLLYADLDDLKFFNRALSLFELSLLMQEVN